MEPRALPQRLVKAYQEVSHHAVGPVLLKEEHEFSTWLTGTPREAFGLIKTSDPNSMRIVQSGLDKEDLLPLVSL